MVPMMVEHLQATPEHESREELTRVVREFVDRLTGKQTIYQMIQLREEVAKRGGAPREALAYKREYLDLLWERIAHRVRGLKEGTIQREEMLVPGCLAMLDGLAQHGVTCYLASGTDLPYVRDEAAALGLTPCFGERIYGALDDWENYSKAMVIQQILRENDLHGPELVTLGDGYVEIENTVQVGGIAVGVASDEVRRWGVDAWKRQRLIGAGAHVIIPDFRQADALLAFLIGA